VGGSLTGEHGIGLEKRDFMPLMYTDDDLEAMRKVKKIFDPEGRLNPGKIFPTSKPGVQVGPAGQREMLDKVHGRT
jgi:FAD/FMN-containing dehydrogenase